MKIATKFLSGLALAGARIIIRVKNIEKKVI